MSYKVEAQSDGKYWCIEVSGIGRATMATSVKEISVMAKGLIESMTGERNSDISIEFANLPNEPAEPLRLKVEVETRDK